MSIPGRKALFAALSGDRLGNLSRRLLGPDELGVDWNGSWNIPVVARAASYIDKHCGSREWFERYFSGQLRGPQGFMGKEFGSRLYSPAVAAAVECVVVFARRREHHKLVEDGTQWLINFYSLAAFCSTTQAPRKREDPSLPFSALTGMRTPSWFIKGSFVDAMLHLTCGGASLPRPYRRSFEKRKLNSRWPVTLVQILRSDYEEGLDGRTSQDLARLRSSNDPELFAALWSSPRMRQDFSVYRTESGLGCWVSRNVNGNKGPLYALVTTANKLSGLHPDPDRKLNAPSGSCSKFAGELVCRHVTGDHRIKLPTGTRWQLTTIQDQQVTTGEG